MNQNLYTKGVLAIRPVPADTFGIRERKLNNELQAIKDRELQAEKDRQNELFDQGKTKVLYPDGRHNSYPSRAVDVTPYPVDWEDRERQTLFAGFVLGVANQMGIKLRWGGDWDMDMEVQDNKFYDFPHFELVK